MRTREEWPELLNQMLRRVVETVVGDDADLTFEASTSSDLVRAVMVSRHRNGRSAKIWTSGDVFHVSFPELDRGGVLIDYDGDEAYLEAILHVLARGAQEYLRGGGAVRYKRGLLGRHPILTMQTEDGEWRLGSWSTIPYPD